MKKLIHILLLLAPAALSAQQKNLPLNREAFIYSSQYLTRQSTSSDSTIHTSFRPIIESKQLSMQRYVYNNSVMYELEQRDISSKKIGPASGDAMKDPARFKASGAPFKTYLAYKLKAESFIWVQPQMKKNEGEEQSLSFNMTIDPLFHLETGKNPDDTSAARLYRNTRGVLVRGDIGKQFSFETSFYENQARFTDYITEYIDSLGVAPGQGRVKGFKANAYDFAMGSGYVSYTPHKRVNIQLGHGKHFVGDGYRSLLLSDNAFNYPYARITTSFWKIQYTNLYTSFMNLTDGGVTTPAFTERLFQKKAGAFQMLSIIPHKRIQLGLFQGMIWEASDTQNKQHLSFNYFNPIIGVNVLPYGLNTTNNIVWGATMKIKVTKGIQLYGQVMIDDVGDDNLAGSINNKTGYQAGFYAFNLFTLKNLNVQAELNSVTPYSYSHKKSEQSYTHYNQPLAHPLGANFKEALGIIDYRIRDFFVQVKYSYAVAGKDSAGHNFGNNVFLSNNSAYHGVASTVNEPLQGLRTTIRNRDIRVGYLINPVTNMNISLGMSMRDHDSATSLDRTSYYYISLRTSLSNIYYDF